MHDAQSPYAQHFALSTQTVLHEVVDDQLREAAWSSTARLRLLSQPHGTLAALKRREHYLRGHMAGLASVFTPRLARRLVAMLAEPEESPAEAFVAAVLLLRCDRAHHEAHVFSAWCDAADPALQHQIGLALCHGELRDPGLRSALVHLLAHPDAPMRAAAASVVGRMGLPAGAAVASVLALGPSQDIEAMVLRLMSQGCWPIEPERLARAVGHGYAPMACAAEAVLANYAPDVLAALTRQQLKAGQGTSLLGLEAVAATWRRDAPGAAQELTQLATLGRRDEGPAHGLHALALVGVPEAAELALEALTQASSPERMDAAIECFAAITGVFEGDGLEGAVESTWEPAARALALRAAWGGGTVGAGPSLFGAQSGAHALLQAAPAMQLGRWQSYARRIYTATAGAIRLPAWRLWQHTATQVHEQAPQIDAALSAGLGAPTPLGQTLRWLLPRRRP